MENNLKHMMTPFTVWFLVGNGGMGYGDYYWGIT